MVKHTQTIRRQQPTNCLSVFDHFVGLALKGLKFSNPFQFSPIFHFYSLENPQKTSGVRKGTSAWSSLCQAISCQCFHFIVLENTRKPLVPCFFQGYKMATIDSNRLKVISLISIDVSQISGLFFFYVVEYFAWLYPFQKCHGFSIFLALSIFEIFFTLTKF